MRSHLVKRARKHISPSLTYPQPRSFSSSSSSLSASRGPYDRTLPNLLLRPETRVIFQGFTGRQATVNATESIAWGTNIVGGVKPGFEGEHLGLPVLPNVKKAMEKLKPDATGIYVAAEQAAAAIEEAIEAEVPLVVAVAEHIPCHDILRIHSMLASQSKTRLVGANAPGIISPIAKCRIGFQPLGTFMPGPVGIIAKSGTLSYETVASLTRAGVGQSLCIGMGGDIVAGTDFVDALKVFEHDPDTKAIVIVGEVGGTAEEEAAEWIREYRARTPNPKPIAALVAGVCAQEGHVMGHAGAWAGPGENSALGKWKALEDAGAVMVDHPAKFGSVMKTLLEHPETSGSIVSSSSSNLKAGQQQVRSLHTNSRSFQRSYPFQTPSNRRLFHLDTNQSRDLLKEYNVPISSSPSNKDSYPESSSILGITIDRSARQPCIVVSPTSSYDDASHIPFDYSTGPQAVQISEALTNLGLRSAPSQVREVVDDTIHSLWKLFLEKHALSVSVALNIDEDLESNLTIESPHVSLDPASKLNTLKAQPEAGKEGIVYVSLPDPSANVGTLVNGAGLAMNTVDALRFRGVSPTNFLDTGGKATSQTVSTAMEMVLSDPRVKLVFVNIFGGLTKCDMIAQGIIQAFDKLKSSGGIKVPVVVRLRGTREEEGQKIISESGLKGVWSFDDFEEAAGKIRDLLTLERHPFLGTES